MKTTALVFGIGLTAVGLVSAVHSQPTTPDLFNELHWRNIGPFRGGRTRAAAGVPGQPNVFYMGQVNGGVWKTDDFGQTWAPEFTVPQMRVPRGPTSVCAMASRFPPWRSIREIRIACLPPCSGTLTGR